MDERSQYKAALLLAQRTLEHIAEHGTPPTPHVYELFYTVSAGLNPALSEAISAAAAGGRISPGKAEELYQQYLAPETKAGTMEEVAQRLAAEISSNLQMLGTAAKSTEAFGASLDTAGRGLGDNLRDHDGTAAARPVLEALVEATQQMSRINAEITENLNASRAQVEDMEQAIRLVREETSRDGLTGLNDRARFDQLLGQAVHDAAAGGRPMCLVMIDIDRFKAINDQFGHLAGDSAIKYVGVCIQSLVKKRGISARYGGEEYTVILPNMGLVAATKLAEKIRAAVPGKELKRKSSGESMGRLTVSAGVAQFAPGDTPETLLDRADMCLLAAKKSGRNRVVSDKDAGALAKPEPAPAHGEAADELQREIA